MATQTKCYLNAYLLEPLSERGAYNGDFGSIEKAV
jgi:hypothetical protein